jgi:hypothetical protein
MPVRPRLRRQRVAVLQGLVEVHTGVDEDDRHLGIDLRDKAKHRCALGAEGGNIGQPPAELAQGDANDFLRRLAAQFLVEARGLLLRCLDRRREGVHSAALDWRARWRFTKMVSLVSAAAW